MVPLQGLDYEKFTRIEMPVCERSKQFPDCRDVGSIPLNRFDLNWLLTKLRCSYVYNSQIYTATSS